MNWKNQIYSVYSFLGHTLAKINKKYYFEDYIRVYPEGIIYNRYGINKNAAPSDIKNFINHSKFYSFAAQFVKNKTVSDIGCGSGYGCKILKDSGAKYVYATDASSTCIKFAKKYFGKYAEFSVQSITNLNKYQDKQFAITICNEVLEHIKEYGKEDISIKELKRVTKSKGLIIIGTPNIEMLPDHGFSYEEIFHLMKNNFKDFVIFENALIPFDKSKSVWQKRLSKKSVGTVISQKINLSETLLPDAVKPAIKKGLKAGNYQFSIYQIDTTLLHNTHSWIAVAINP